MFDIKKRVFVVSVFGVVYVLAHWIGSLTLPGHLNATGIRDLGHALVPSLELTLGRRGAEFVWWIGTLPLELSFLVIVLAVLFTGKGVRIGFCLYGMYLLHWIFLHATTLPPPDHSVWEFPGWVFTLGKPKENDFWFSGHVANAFVLALATDRSRLWVRIVAWLFVLFEVLLVLSARTHYTIDVIGGMFVAYTVHRLSLQWKGKLC